MGCLRAVCTVCRKVSCLALSDPSIGCGVLESPAHAQQHDVEDSRNDDDHSWQCQGRPHIVHGEVQDCCGSKHRTQLDQLILVEQIRPGRKAVYLSTHQYSITQGNNCIPQPFLS